MERSEPTLFVVDDELAARASLMALASSMGLRCETFFSGQQFLDRFEPSLCGCLIADLRMPGVDGLQLQDRLRSLGSLLPVILVTAYPSVPSVVRAMQNGAVTVLEKPYDANQLEEAIRQAMRSHRQIRDESRRQTELRRRFDNLEPREREALALIVHGMPNKAIARELSVSQRTVDRIRAGIFEKMGAESAVDLASMAGELWRTTRSAAPIAGPHWPSLADCAVHL